jgi:hypothetical protein
MSGLFGDAAPVGAAGTISLATLVMNLDARSSAIGVSANELDQSTRSSIICLRSTTVADPVQV